MVLGIMAESAYEEKAYSYLIMIHTEAGYTLYINDWHRRTHEADLGTTRELDIIALLPSVVEKIDNCELKTIPSPYHHNPHAEFITKIVDIIKYSPGYIEFIIDIGKGTINIDPSTFYQKFSMLEDGSVIGSNGIVLRKGDFVHIASPRLDLRSIKPINSNSSTLI